MNGFTSKLTGGLVLLVGVTGILAVITLLLFFVGLFQNIQSLSFMGHLNDTINGVAGILSAVLASVLYPTVRRFSPRFSLILLIGVWVGAIAITFGSWLIVTGRSDVELSSYYYFLGNGLIGIWLWELNRITHRQAAWPHNLTRLGLIASAFMMIGLLGLYGILLGLDGSDFSPLMMVSGFSYLGTGILYPIWGLRQGLWILSKQNDRARQGPRLFAQPGHGIRSFYRNAHQGQMGNLADMLHELVTCLPVAGLVAFVVQFDARQGADCLRVAEQEALRVCLRVDLVVVDAELAVILGSHVEEITQPDLDADDRLIGNGCFQDAEEIMFGRGEETGASNVRVFRSSGDFLPLSERKSRMRSMMSSTASGDRPMAPSSLRRIENLF